MQNTNIKTDIKIIQASPADLDAVTAVEAVCFPAAEAAGRQSFAHRLAAFPAVSYTHLTLPTTPYV